jgi:hypothetical protein
MFDVWKLIKNLHADTLPLQEDLDRQAPQDWAVFNAVGQDPGPIMAGRLPGTDVAVRPGLGEARPGPNVWELGYRTHVSGGLLAP